MTVLDYILDGIEAELALERELGIRSVECDRSVLAVAERQNAGTPRPFPLPPPPRPPQTPHPPRPLQAPRPLQDSLFDFVFLHDGPLTPEGEDLMAKVIPAMGKTPETAPIVFAGEVPKAKAYVVLGGKAMNRWLPGTKAAPGDWPQTTVLPNVLVTYSPNYIFKFGNDSPTVRQMKRAMWTSLKAVMQRVSDS